MSHVRFCLNNCHVFKAEITVDNTFSLTRQYNFMNLFSSARIIAHMPFFPLVNQFLYPNGSLLSLDEDSSITSTTENSYALSANCLMSVYEPRGK